MSRQLWRERRTKELLKLRKEGFEISELTPYQFRVNSRLDIYPTRAKWHDIRLNARGEFKDENAAKFVKRYFECVGKKLAEASKAYEKRMIGV